MFLFWNGLIVLLMTRDLAASPAICRISNCKFTVADECQHSETVNCNLRKQDIKKMLPITKMSFPKYVRDIIIRNVEEMEIQADAIGSLEFLESIELTHIGTLTLLPHSLARTNEYRRKLKNAINRGTTITIRHVKKFHMANMAVAPSTLIHSLNLVNIKNLTIETNAFATDSVIDNMLLTDVISLTVENGALSPNTTIKSMGLEDITYMNLHTGAFARNSFIENAVVERVNHLLIHSGGIQSNISKLTISDVFMENCEDNTFGTTIQAMSLASSQIKIAKSGCISASSGWEELLVEKCTFDYIESLAIRGTIKHVQIKASFIGAVETGGFTLNVTNFTVESVKMGRLSEKALAVSAAEVITLKNCKVTKLKKHAFSLLQLKSSAKKRIRIKNLDIDEFENESMRFATGSNVVVSQLMLNIPCTCDMVQMLELSSRMQMGDGNDPKKSNWLVQTRCKSNATTTTLAKYKRENCTDHTTTTTSLSSSSSSSGSGGGILQSGSSLSPKSTTGQNKSSVPGLTSIDSVNTWFVIGTIIVVFLL